MSLIVSLAALLCVPPQGVAAPGFGSPASAVSTLSWKDFDRDGREDVYVVRSGSADRLLRNLGDGSFEERSLALPAPCSHSATWGDFDGDGWADLFLSARLGGVRLFTNLGDGRFAERTSAAGLAGIPGGRVARGLDYDGDGRLDVALEGAGEAVLLHNLGTGAFAEVRLGGASPAPLALPSSASSPVPVVAAPPGTGARAPLSPAPSAGAVVGGTGGGTSESFVATTPTRAGLAVAGPVPSGYMILGDTLTAPAGYTSTGLVVKPDTWIFRGPMPGARYGVGAAAIGAKAYVVGGSDGVGFVSTLEEYDAVSNTWTTKAPMANPRMLPVAVAVNGKVYAIGGQDNSGVLGTVEEYDPVLDTWTPRAPMPTPRTTLGAAAVSGKIYAIGGLDNSGMLSTVEEYDPVANSWATKASMACPRGYVSAAASGGRVYVFGGHDGNSPVSTLAEYDPVSNTWTPKTSLVGPRMAGTATTFGGKIYLAGGQNFSTVLNSVHRYDPGTDTWAIQADLHEEVEFHGAAVANSKLYIFGGVAASALDSTEEYDPTLLYAHKKN